MSDSFESQPWLQIGVGAALLRSYSQDAVGFFPMIAELFQRAMPNQVSLKHSGFLRKELSEVTIEFEGARYSLRKGKFGLEAFLTHMSRGIALKSEPMPLADWIEELGNIIQRKAESDRQAAQALSAVLGLS